MIGVQDDGILNITVLGKLRGILINQFATDRFAQTRFNNNTSAIVFNEGVHNVLVVRHSIFEQIAQCKKVVG